MNDGDCPHEPIPIDSGRRQEQIALRCEICDKIMVGQNQWQEHITSNRHKKTVKRLQNEVELDQVQGSDKKPRFRRRQGKTTERSQNNQSSGSE